jgi:hypothetical protein
MAIGRRAIVRVDNVPFSILCETSTSTSPSTCRVSHQMPFGLSFISYNFVEDLSAATLLFHFPPALYSVLFSTNMKLSSGSIGILLLLPLLSAMAAVVLAQEYDYDDYPQQDYGSGQDYYGADAGGYYQEEDTLYHDYAKHQEEKAIGAGK